MVSLVKASNTLSTATAQFMFRPGLTENLFNNTLSLPCCTGTDNTSLVLTVPRRTESPSTLESFTTRDALPVPTAVFTLTRTTVLSCLSLPKLLLNLANVFRASKLTKTTTTTITTTETTTMETTTKNSKSTNCATEFTNSLPSAKATWTSTGLIPLDANTSKTFFPVSRRPHVASRAVAAPNHLVPLLALLGFSVSQPSSLLLTPSSFTENSTATEWIFQALTEPLPKLDAPRGLFYLQHSLGSYNSVLNSLFDRPCSSYHNINFKRNISTDLISRSSPEE